MAIGLTAAAFALYALSDSKPPSVWYTLPPATRQNLGKRISLRYACDEPCDVLGARFVGLRDEGGDFRDLPRRNSFEVEAISLGTTGGRQIGDGLDPQTVPLPSEPARVAILSFSPAQSRWLREQVIRRHGTVIVEVSFHDEVLNAERVAIGASGRTRALASYGRSEAPRVPWAA
jgi:hypothetical protein